ncbi:MAG: hypothetical protein ACYCPW_05685 [Nitrososphaerales archaeon]
MKGVFVDFWTDTLDNLADLSNSNNVPRNELIRRGSEAVLVLYGIPKSGIGEMLVEELKESERVLSNKPVNTRKLVKSLSNSTALSSTLSAIYAVNDGKEEASIIRVYFRTIQEHLQAIADPKYVGRQEDYETILEDVTSFANILAKLGKSRSELQNPATLHNSPTGNKRNQSESHQSQEPAQTSESIYQLHMRSDSK